MYSDSLVVDDLRASVRAIDGLLFFQAVQLIST